MRLPIPKPLHGWHQFAGEVGIIVLGVVIALALGQIAQELQWRGDVRSARTALGADIRTINDEYAFRIVGHKCIADRLAKLTNVVERVAKHESVAKIVRVMPDIGAGLPSNGWESSKAAGTLSHFSQEILSAYGSYFTEAGIVQTFINREADDWGVIRVLEGDPARLGAVDIASIRVALKRASFDNDLITAIATGELHEANQLGVRPSQADSARVSEVCGLN